jgi:hypothetical protein
MGFPAARLGATVVATDADCATLFGHSCGVAAYEKSAKRHEPKPDSFIIGAFSYPAIDFDIPRNCRAEVLIWN